MTTTHPITPECSQTTTPSSPGISNSGTSPKTIIASQVEYEEIKAKLKKTKEEAKTWLHQTMTMQSGDHALRREASKLYERARDDLKAFIGKGIVPPIRDSHVVADPW